MTFLQDDFCASQSLLKLTNVLPLAADAWLLCTARTKYVITTLCMPNSYCHVRAKTWNGALKAQELMNSTWLQKSNPSLTYSDPFLYTVWMKIF